MFTPLSAVVSSTFTHSQRSHLRRSLALPTDLYARELGGAWPKMANSEVFRVTMFPGISCKNYPRPLSIRATCTEGSTRGFPQVCFPPWTGTYREAITRCYATPDIT